MKMIVTVDRNWGLTWNHQPLVKLPSEYRFIQQQTAGKVVVMDYDTLRAFPGEKAIGGRETIVLCAGRKLKEPGVQTASNLSELEERLAAYDAADVYICGGSSVYEQYLKQCDTVYVTWVDYEYRAETWFPRLDQSDEWILAKESEEQTYYDLAYYVRVYTRKNGDRK